MALSSPLDHEAGRPWTIDDLDDFPDVVGRVEILDGSLLLTPPPALDHGNITNRLHRLLDRQAPPGLAAWQGAGIEILDGTSYYIPDLLVPSESAIVHGRKAFRPEDVLLVVEVLSEHNKHNDLVVKRTEYAVAKIREYWIVDPDQKTLTILRRGSEAFYQEQAVLRPGETWDSDWPFPLTLDPADFL
jgi:Uma2 family endonuclease